MPTNPNPEFINMIHMLYNNRQSSITNQDQIKHSNNKTAFYSISRITVRNGRVVSQTQPFSEQLLIEIEQGCDNMHFISEHRADNYRRTSPVEFSVVHGKGLLHWNVESENQQVYVAVKLMSDDGCVQIKLITADEVTQLIYNVCELPAHLGPNF